MSDASLDIQIKGNSTGFGRVAVETTRQLNGIKEAALAISARAVPQMAAAMMAFMSLDFLRQKVAGVVDYAGSISDLSDRVAVTTEFLQSAEYAAEQFGASLGDVVLAVRELKRSSANAIMNPGGTDAKAFAALGISLARLKALSAEDLFRAVADAMASGSLSGQRLNDAINLMGRSASNLMPMLRGGFSELAEEAKRLGIVINGEVVSKLDEVGDRWGRVLTMLRSKFANFVADTITALERVADTTKMVVETLADIGGTSAHPGKIFGALADGWRGLKEQWNSVGNNGPVFGPPVPPGFDEDGGRTARTKSLPLPVGPSNADAMQRLGLFLNGTSPAAIAAKHLSVAEKAMQMQQETLREMRTRL